MWRFSQAAFFRGFFLLAFVVLRKNFRLDRLTSFRAATCAPAHRNAVLLFYSNAAYPNRDMAFLRFVALSVPIGQLCKHVNNGRPDKSRNVRKLKKRRKPQSRNVFLSSFPLFHFTQGGHSVWENNRNTKRHGAASALTSVFGDRNTLCRRASVVFDYAEK